MRNLAGYIDHTLLRADACRSEIAKFCAEAERYSFASVCINPKYIEYSKELLLSSNVKVCTVIGFPLGASTLKMKLYEVGEVISLGAEEIDMVIDIGNVKNQRYDMVIDEISSIQDAISKKAILKVIVETSLLSLDEKVKLSEICRDLRVDFIKTSTGFSTGGARLDDIKLIKSIVGDTIGIKASGGIRTHKTAVEMIAAGATRIGASSSVDIVNKNN